MSFTKITSFVKLTTMTVINCGHRGASASFPENTIIAFKQALRMGASSVELDVRLCKTGELLVVHDKNLKLSINGQKELSKLEFSELQTAIQEGRLATLELVLTELQGQYKGVNPIIYIELKGAQGAIATVVADVIAAYCSDHRYKMNELRVIGFNRKHLRMIHELLPESITGLSCFPLPFFYHLTVWRAKRCQASGINPYYTLITTRLVQLAHKNGLAVNAWPVNSGRAMDRLIVSNVDCIMTDFPDLLQQKL